MSETELEKCIQNSISILAPVFDISVTELAAFRKPTVALFDSFHSAGIRGKYFHDQARFEFSKNHFNGNLPDLKCLGHEVSHYLHHELNPQVLKKMEEAGSQEYIYWRGVELREFVAELGGIVYATMQSDIFVLTEKVRLDHGDGHYALVYNHYAECGYTRAQNAFKFSKGNFLSRLARMSIEESKRIISREFPINFYERVILPLFDKSKINL
jgi:hypothetical protein